MDRIKHSLLNTALWQAGQSHQNKFDKGKKVNKGKRYEMKEENAV
jgi:hypothetical protein